MGPAITLCEGYSRRQDRDSADDTAGCISLILRIRPADNPSIIVLVVLFDLKAIPTWRRHSGARGGKIIEDILNYMQVKKKYTEEDLRTMTEGFVPEVRGKPWKMPKTSGRRDSSIW